MCNSAGARTTTHIVGMHPDGARGGSLRINVERVLRVAIEFPTPSIRKRPLFLLHGSPLISRYATAILLVVAGIIRSVAVRAGRGRGSEVTLLLRCFAVSWWCVGEGVCVGHGWLWMREVRAVDRSSAQASPSSRAASWVQPLRRSSFPLSAEHSVSACRGREGAFPAAKEDSEEPRAERRLCNALQSAPKHRRAGFADGSSSGRHC